MVDLSLVTLLAVLVLATKTEMPALPAIEVDHLPAGVRERVATAVRRARDEPGSAAAAGELAMLLHAHEQLSSSSAAYKRARALDGGAFEWPYLGGLAQLQAGQPAEAVPLLREAVARRPRSLPARLRLGEALLASGNAEEARTHYRAILGEHRDIPQVHYGLGRAEAARGDSVAAAESYRTAVRLFPAYGAAHYALGLTYRDLAQSDKAHEHLLIYQRHLMDAPGLHDPVLDRVLRLKEDAGDALAEGVRLAAAGDLAGAIREHERALAIDGSLTRAHANLIGLYAQAQRWEKVEEHYRAAAALAIGQAEVEYNYGLALQQQERRTEAAEAFRRVLAASPLHASAHNQLGLLLEAEGRLEEALERYRQAVANQAAFRTARFNLGRVLVHLGRPGEAIRQFEQILEPDDDETPRYLYALGAAWARAGDREKALAHLEDARRRASGRGQAELLVSIDRDLGRLKGLSR